MGKAGKWIRNFLMGKREDNCKKTICSSVSLEATTPVTVVSSTNTPRVRRRWSFKRSTSKKTVMSHRSSISLDSIVTPKWGHCATVLSAYDAATKIQAAYRSYLARRALRALRGLVKLQALVRGYLVRKQMNTVVRSVHAVMKIQVRARIHRVQMTEDMPPGTVGRRKSYQDSFDSHRHIQNETNENTIDANSSFRPSGGLRSRSHRADYTLADRQEFKICSSDRLSVSQKDYKPHVVASPTALSFTDSTSTTYDRELDEFSVKMARQNSGRNYSSTENNHPFICLPGRCPDYTPSDSHLTPNYMTDTKSSKAKARSHSEPRQRPGLNNKKQRSRRTSSMDEKNEQENQYPWLIKLYRAGTPKRDRESCVSASKNISNGRKSLIPFYLP